MKIGLIGIGNFGIKWFDVIPEGVMQVILRRNRSTWGDRSGLFTTDMGEFLERCTHVIVASPTETHFSLAKACLCAHRSVLCEKPLATNSMHVKRLADLSRMSQRPIWVNYAHLWHPTVEKLPRRNVDAECVFRGPTPREPLMDWGPHALAAAFWLIGTDAHVSRWAVSSDKQRCQVDLESKRGRVRCDFGASPVKTTRIKMNAPERTIYTGEPCDPDPMTRLFRRWVANDGDDRTDIELSIAVHRVLDEVTREKLGPVPSGSYDPSNQGGLS